MAAIKRDAVRPWKDGRSTSWYKQMIQKNKLGTVTVAFSVLSIILFIPLVNAQKLCSTQNCRSGQRCISPTTAMDCDQETNCRCAVDCSTAEYECCWAIQALQLMNGKGNPDPTTPTGCKSSEIILSGNSVQKM